MATVTFPINRVPVPCAKIAYVLPTDNAAAMQAAINTAVVTHLGWTLADTVGTTSIFTKTIGGVVRYVSVEVDYSGTVEKLKIKGYAGWDAGNNVPTGNEYKPQRHEVNLGSGTYSWALFVYDRPSTAMFLQFTNRP